MTNAEYSPGDTLADELGTTITVIRQVHDGRYEVAYDHTQRSILSGRTIRALYPVAAVVAALALAFTGMASAATPKQVREAKTLTAATVQPGNLTPSVTCRSTGPRTVSCEIASPGAGDEIIGYAIVGGKLRAVSHRHVVNATMVRAAKAVTLGQREALQDARSYIQNVGGFSLNGLIGQVESDGFSKANATYGATHTGANWDKEAAQDARSYLQNVGGFSASGLIGQLESDGFTASQARYGAKTVGY